MSKEAKNMRKKKFPHFIMTTILVFSILVPVGAELSMYDGKVFARNENVEETVENNQKKESKPIFSFTEEKIKSRAGETFSLTFVSNKEVKEATIHLPKEASIVKASLPVGVTVEELEEDYWLLRSDEYRATFTIPLVVEEEGTYEAFTSNEKTTMEITPLMTETHSGGKLLNQDESTDSEENFDEIVEENTSNELEEIRSDNEMSYILTESGIANVSDWTGFAQALGTPSISTIEIKQDFEVPTVSNVSGFITGGSSNPSGGEVHVNLTPANSSRTLTVNGNGHHIDFGAVTINAARATHNAQSPWDITFNDLTVYSGNWWGFFTVGRTLTVAQQSETRLALNNVESIGNQLFAPYYANVELFGVIENHVVESYTSAFRNNFNVNTGNTVNIESRNLTIKENAVVNFSSLNAGNLIIGLGGLEASLKLEKNATLNMMSNGTGAGVNANGLGASIDILNGDLIMEEGSVINLDTTRSYSAIQLRSASSSLQINKDAQINLNSTNHTHSTNQQHRNLIYMATGSSLLVEENGQLNIEAVGRGSANSNVIHVAGNADFRIAKDGLLDIKSDGTSISQSLINFASAGSIFKFSDAQKVNLERTTPISGSTSNGLININGSTGLLDIDVQAVQQWNRDNLTEIPDYSWTPIFNLNLQYNTINPTITNVSSIFQETRDSFEEHFTTRDVQRILFEKIPDVEVTINPLSEDALELNSYLITGKATPNSVIRFSGDIALPEGTIESPNILETEKYHIIADLNGDYQYELPEGAHFTAGNEVTAYAFLNGKSDTASTIVEETKRSPNPKDPLDPETEVNPESKPVIPEDQGRLSIDFASQFNFGSQDISVQDKNYYAQPQRLLNEDGTVNEQEKRPNYVQISDRRSETDRNGWQLSVTQNNQFSTENGKELSGARMRLTNQQLATAHGGTAPSLQQTEPLELVPGAKRVLLMAQGNEGTGTWIYRFGNANTAGNSVVLDVPKGANPEATSYSSTFTWELSAVPGN